MVEPISCILGVALIQVVSAIVGVLGAIKSVTSVSLVGLAITFACSVYIITYFLKGLQKDTSTLTLIDE